MWFLNRFRFNLLKNNVPFENSAREGGFLKAPFSNLTFQSRFPKRMWIGSRFRLNLLKNHVPFENSAREGGFLESPFSNLTFQSRFPKRMWFLKRFRLNLLKNHVPFENSAREGGFLKSPFSNLTFQRADFQKECGFWADLGLISSKTMFLLGILLLKVVFSNQLFQIIQIWLFREQISKKNVVFG